MWNAEHGQPGARPVDDVDLTMLDEAFAAAQVPEGFERVPDQDYEVRVERVEIVKAKTTGNPALKWTLKILGPDCAGRRLWRYNVLNSPQNMGWLKKDLRTCGVVVEKASDLRENLARLLDLRLRVRVKTKGENQNIYIVGCLGAGGDGDGSGGSEAVPI